MTKTAQPTPRVDAAERFMRSGDTGHQGFVMSPLARQLECELIEAVARLRAAGLPVSEQGSDEAFELEQAKPGSAALASVLGPSASAASSSPMPSTGAAPPARLAPSKTPTNAGKTVSYEDGQVLFHQGDSAQHLAIIVQGAVEVFDPADNLTMATLGVGSSFGEQAVLEGGVRGASVRAVGQVKCIQISTGPLRALLRNDTGLLRPTIEALLLQLGMVNHITRLLATPGGPTEYRIDGEEKFSAQQLQRKLAEVHSQAESHGLSAEQLMFLKLESDEKLLTSLYPAGRNFAADSVDDLGDAYVLVAGTVEGRFGNKVVQLGRGSILGLAEAISGELVPWRLTATTKVTVKTLSIDKVLRDLERANSGLRGIVRYTTARILDLQKTLVG
jgi:CRP/FNR family cyclic AMP-dependent transcriptional regulator